VQLQTNFFCVENNYVLMQILLTFYGTSQLSNVY
jgi:hypothetical protein